MIAVERVGLPAGVAVAGAGGEGAAEPGGSMVVLFLDAPSRRNALTPADLTELTMHAARMGEHGLPVVLAGRGAMFSAGFDLKLCAAEAGAMGELLEGLSCLIRTLRSCASPVVVAAHGGAIAGACALLGGADYIVTDRAAALGYPVARIGLSPGVSAPFLTSAVAAGQARRLMLDPGLIDGTRALEIGLVHECVESPGEVLAAALRAAVRLGGKPRGAFTATKFWLARVEAALHPGRDVEPGVWAERGLGVSLATAASGEHARMLAAAHP